MRLDVKHCNVYDCSEFQTLHLNDPDFRFLKFRENEHYLYFNGHSKVLGNLTSKGQLLMETIIHLRAFHYTLDELFENYEYPNDSGDSELRKE